MSKVLIINAHHHYPFSEGKLNKTLETKINDHLVAQGHSVRKTRIDEGWDTDQEIANHEWADLLVLQTPVNWMGVPWTYKKYMDEVFTAGMDGRLCHGDGRSESQPKSNYGAGGALKGKKYMLSLTFNAPEESFDDDTEYLFQGKSVDDLLFPMHMNFRFFGMEALPTFACFDVMKNADIDNDIQRLSEHLTKHLR